MSSEYVTSPQRTLTVDDLDQRLLSNAIAFRASGYWSSKELAPLDLAATNLLYELGEITAAGGDIRSHLFG